jgi:hypothetical protein
LVTVDTSLFILVFGGPLLTDLPGCNPHMGSGLRVLF